jgi:subtilisin family serine protease
VTHVLSPGINNNELVDDKQLALDVAIPEVGANQVWDLLDSENTPITGEGVLVAVLDTGVDWRHPHLWFADGDEYDWIDSSEDTDFQNMTDGIDIDGNAILADSERAYFIDIDEDGEFDTSTEWIWVDNVSQDAFPQDGEPFFVVDDSNSNDRLNPGETLVMLETPKTKYIAERDANTDQIVIWERNSNLTVSTHHDRDGHGTATSGIVLGGQIGYREYLGVAPGADLLMIRIHGYDNETLDTIEALDTARELGADVVLLEEGQWIERFLDGSSEVEQLIDELAEDGIPVVVPAGNLGNADKHCKFDIDTSEDSSHAVSFQVPTTLMTDSIWITLVTQSDVDFMDADIEIISPNGIIMPVVFEYGYRVYRENFNGILNIRTRSYVLNSSRGTKLIQINIQKPTSIGGVPRNEDPYRLVIDLPRNATIHGYISENPQRWSGGVTWTSDVSDEYVLTHPATADEAIPVLSYHTRFLWAVAGEISEFSPLGPRIDGNPKYGIAAPGGYDIVSCYGDQSAWLSWYNGPAEDFPFTPRFGSYRLISGTSAAGGFVAGCVALMLQILPDGGEIVEEVLGATARSDVHTGAIPNDKWGNGKLDVNASVHMILALLEDVTAPTLGIPQVNPALPDSTQAICVNVTASDDLLLNEVLLSYITSSGPFNITMTWTGSYYEAEIPPQSPGATISYRIYATDLAGNTGWTETYQITVQDPLVMIVLPLTTVLLIVTLVLIVIIWRRKSGVT